MMEMSTPVTSLWDHILMLPVVGIIDSRRAANMMSSVLHKIAETRAKVFIIDIGGVSVVDTAVANHLIKITQAARLMGCVCLLSGVSPAIAQTTIELGIDVGNVLTRATMRDALEEAFRLIEVEVRRA
jgi:rsbT co-antagonist protein RsbR